MACATAPTVCLAGGSGVLFDTHTNPNPADAFWGWHAVGTVDQAAFDTVTDRRDTVGWWLDLKQNPLPEGGTDLTVVFDLQAESHSSSNRAGFTIAWTTPAGKSLVVNVWEDEVWLSAEAPLSTHGESLKVNCKGRHELRIEESNGLAAVSIDGRRVGRVELRDFSSVAGVPEGFLQSATLFIGDSSTSAGAKVTLDSVKWQPRGGNPELAKAVLTTGVAVFATAGLVGVWMRRKPRERQTGRIFIDRS